MNIWENSKWQLYYATKPCRKGLRVHYEKGVEPEVKRAIRDCIKWLRSEYVFPKRVNLYVKSAERIKAKTVIEYAELFSDRRIEMQNLS